MGVLISFLLRIDFNKIKKTLIPLALFSRSCFDANVFASS